VPLNPVAVAVLLSDPQRQLMEKLTGSDRHEGLMSPVPLLRSGSVADGCRAWMVVALLLVLAAAPGCRDECWESWFLPWRRPPLPLLRTLGPACCCIYFSLSVAWFWTSGSEPNKAWGRGEEVFHFFSFSMYLDLLK